MRSPPSLDETRDQLFLIVGMGRSGTSLLQMMLESHPDATLPPELAFYSVVWPWFRVRRWLYGRRQWDRLLAHPRLVPLGLSATDVRAALGPRSNRDTVFLAILDAHRRSKQVPRVGEKSPGNFHQVRRLARTWPHVKFIHVVRDPRAVVASQLRTSFKSDAVTLLTRRWRERVALRGWAIANVPDRFLEVRYEQLVADPESVLHRVCEFLELPYDDRMLQYHQREHANVRPEQLDHMAGTFRPVFTDGIDRWREQLSPDDITKIQHIAGPMMARLDYEPAPLPARRVRSSEWLRDWLSDAMFRARKKLARRGGRPPAAPSG